MKLIVNSRLWSGTATELANSTVVLESGDRVFKKGDTSKFKLADGVTTVASLPWTHSAVKTFGANAVNVTATLTGSQVAKGLITSTSAAAVAATLPTAALLLAALGTPGADTKKVLDFIVDNSAGANTVTVVASASITAATAVVTGGATLTIASGAVGLFKIFFTSATVAKIYRVG